jgi:hypothetical protein
MKTKNKTKPSLLTQDYYDFDSVADYLGWSESKKSKVWNYIIDITDDSMNGRIFTISNWELVYNNGEFKKHIPKWYIPVIEQLIEHFSKIDANCKTPNTKTANFRSSW